MCDLVWLENLNLRGSFKAGIMAFIAGKHPDLRGSYERIYACGDRGYWGEPDVRLRAYAEDAVLEYVANDDILSRPFDAQPAIANFFYHEKIRKSARNGRTQRRRLRAARASARVFPGDGRRVARVPAVLRQGMRIHPARQGHDHGSLGIFHAGELFFAPPSSVPARGRIAAVCRKGALCI